MQIDTKAYGKWEIDERQIIDFPQGLLGFGGYNRWALLDSDQAPFYWLQSLEEVDIAFVILSPFVFRPDFNLELSDADREGLGNPEDSDLLVFSICTIPENQDNMTANLQGPVVINRKARIGRQTIQNSTNWKVRHRILDELKRSTEQGSGAPAGGNEHNRSSFESTGGH